MHTTLTSLTDDTLQGLMKKALVQAKTGVDAGHGGPFGACIAHGVSLVALAHNTVLRDADPTAHAEINAIREACRLLGTHDLSGCVLVCTAEPCPMCYAAIRWARISALVYGASMACAAKFGFDDVDFESEFSKPTLERSLPSRGGILAGECETLFHHWHEASGHLYSRLCQRNNELYVAE